MRWLRISGGVMAAVAFVSGCIQFGLVQHQATAKPKPDCTAPEVETSSGSVCGLLDSDDKRIHTYLGIPYAGPVSGNRRWTSPSPAEKVTGTFQATGFGPVCPQPAKRTPFPQSEDCLSLNIWTPARSGARRPVMVFIHGGAFFFGSSANPVYDGRILAERGDVVVVTLNYRLGALGFLAGIDGFEGNYGFLDQQLALRWVRDNIAAFGGDPSKVTLFGESAGAMSVALHLTSPESRRYFRAAIMESNPYGLPYKSVTEAGRFGKRLRSALGCSEGDTDCLRQRPAHEVVKHEASLRLRMTSYLAGFSGQLAWSPVLDGKVLTNQPNQDRISKPAIIGTNRDEGVIFAQEARLGLLGRQIPRIEYRLVLELLFSKRLAKKVEALPRYAPIDGDNTWQFSNVLTDYLFTCANRHVMNRSKRPVHGYLFTHVPSYNVMPRDKLCAPGEDRVCHEMELPFVFGSQTTVTVENPPLQAQFTPDEKLLSGRMVDYWTHFATTMTPNSARTPDWPRYRTGSKVVQILNNPITRGNSTDANCSFWDTLGYDLPGLYDRLHEKTKR